MSSERLTVEFGGHVVSASGLLKVFALLVLFAAPNIFGSFFLDLLMQALILAVFAVSVDLLWGYAGILTFGHAAFFGFGAYITAKLLLTVNIAGISYVALGLAVLLPGIAGLIIAGALFYRGVSEEYFTIITLAVAIIAKQIAVSWKSVTNGFNGLNNIPSFELGIPGLLMTPAEDIVLYYVIVAVVIGVYFFGKKVVASPFGTSLIAIDKNETKAQSLGYDTRKYKTLVFALSGAIAGLSGAVFAGYSSFVSPPLLGFLLSTEVLIWVLVGGRGTIIGAIVGTIFLSVFENSLSGVFQFSWTLLLGIVLVAIVLFFPGGIIGTFKENESRLLSRFGGKNDE